MSTTPRRWRNRLDTLQAFVDEVCVCEPEKKVLRQELWYIYFIWARENGVEAWTGYGPRPLTPASLTMLNKFIEERGIPHNATGGSHWRGFWVRDEQRWIARVSEQMPWASTTLQPYRSKDDERGTRREVRVDQTHRFLTACCEAVPLGRVSTTVLYTAYLAWCVHVAERGLLSRLAFTRHVHRLGHDLRKDGYGATYLRGLVLKEQDDGHVRQGG